MNQKTRKIGIAVAIGAAGVAAGGVLATTLSASAESTGSATGARGYGAPPNANPDNPTNDPSKPLRSDEKLLTGTTKDKVTAAVKKKYPNATFQRVETDSDGVYEAHILNNGTPLTVEVGKDFTITGTEQGGPGGPGGHGPGDHDGDGLGQPPATSQG